MLSEKEMWMHSLNYEYVYTALDWQSHCIPVEFGDGLYPFHQCRVLPWKFYSFIWWPLFKFQVRNLFGDDLVLSWLWKCRCSLSTCGTATCVFHFSLIPDFPLKLVPSSFGAQNWPWPSQNRKLFVPLSKLTICHCNIRFERFYREGIFYVWCRL